MEMDIISAVSTVGFPIAMAIYLIYAGNKRDEKNAETIEELRKTVENNTLTVQKLIDKLNIK